MKIGYLWMLTTHVSKFPALSAQDTLRLLLRAPLEYQIADEWVSSKARLTAFTVQADYVLIPWQQDNSAEGRERHPLRPSGAIRGGGA